jgi:hypothetical protein
VSEKPEFDPDYINQVIKESVQAIHDLEKLLLEAAKAMTRLAAALSTMEPYLRKPPLEDEHQ